MPTSVQFLVDRLNTLIGLSFNAADLSHGAYHAARSPADQRVLHDMSRMHRRHASSLMLLVDTLGGRISSAPLLPTLRIRHNAANDDPSPTPPLLTTLTQTVEEAHRLYAELLKRADLPIHVRGVLCGNRANQESIYQKLRGFCSPDTCLAQA